MINYYIDQSSGEFLNLALIAYTFTTGVEHEVLVHAHGNSNTGQPYQKTLPSTLKQVKDEVKANPKPSKSIVSTVSSKQGGILGVHSAGELPQNQKQVYNSRQLAKTNRHSHLCRYSRQMFCII